MEHWRKYFQNQSKKNSASPHFSFELSLMNDIYIRMSLPSNANALNNTNDSISSSATTMHSTPYREMPGSVTLKSSIPMEYSRAVLTNIWHQKREAEPKENDLNKLPVRNMHISTYKRIANHGETNLPRSTAQDQQEQPFLERAAYTEHAQPRHMIDGSNIDVANAALEGLINRADPQRNRHLLPAPTTTDYRKANLESTYQADFPPPYPYEMKTVTHSEYADQNPPKYPDKSWAYRKMISHFTDLDKPKRPGINTFHVQHAQYENEQMRRDVGLFKPTHIP